LTGLDLTLSTTSSGTLGLSLVISWELIQKHIEINKKNKEENHRVRFVPLEYSRSQIQRTYWTPLWTGNKVFYTLTNRVWQVASSFYFLFLMLLQLVESPITTKHIS
jgi:hypothetical protein